MVFLRNILAIIGLLSLVIAFAAYHKIQPMMNLYHSVDDDTKTFVHQKFHQLAEMEPSKLQNYIENVKQFDPKAMEVYTEMADTLIKTGNTAEATVWAVPVEEGISVDDVVDSMKSIATEKNFANVGQLPLYKDIIAKSGKPHRYVEMFLFCDSLIASKMLTFSDAFSAYFPCRITLVEDESGKLWLYTLNMDMMIYGGKTLPPELLKEALKVKETILAIMKGGAKGEF